MRTALVSVLVCALCGACTPSLKPSDTAGETGLPDTGDDTGVEPNYALGFDRDGYGQTEELSATALGSTFTVEFWLRVDSFVEGYFLDARTPGDHWISGWNAYQLESAGSNLVFRWGDENQVVHNVEGPDLNDLDQGWHHIAAGCDAMCWLFLDGALVDEREIEARPAGGPTPLFLGVDYEGDYEHLQGVTIDDLRISDHGRYTAAFVPDAVLEQDEQTQALWHFDEGEGETASDSVFGASVQLTSVEWTSVDR